MTTTILTGHVLVVPDPTEDDLRDPRFDAVWQAIKGWDIERSPGEGYAHATGTDVMTVLRAIDGLGSPSRDGSSDSELIAT